ncbi:MAG: hypothetical protein IJA17_02255, partial [Oscillospiraceae bacterium]|nr:hypothetical protein [Oscillospiraceae bacterium]
KTGRFSGGLKMLMRLLTFRRVLRRRRIMPLKGLCKPPAQLVVMILYFSLGYLWRTNTSSEEEVARP